MMERDPPKLSLIEETSSTASKRVMTERDPPKGIYGAGFPRKR